MWYQQQVLVEDQCLSAEEDTGTKALDTLQGDIMEIITAL